MRYKSHLHDIPPRVTKGGNGQAREQSLPVRVPMPGSAALSPFPRDAGRTEVGVRRAKAAFLSGCKYHPAILLQPEAIGAVMEVTK